ncbi:hypothetical protein [Saccharopolyspora taberi]|uniref:hypothetical protein n=1 Tax=Saccharopolyspora taberi TaxID=60895 RepID=UPI0031D8EE8F
MVGEEERPADLLLRWKQEREAPETEALAGLRGVTESRLEEILAEAVESRDAQISDALDRLQEVDSEAAGVLRGFVDEIKAARRPGLSPGAVDVLDSAAHRLRNLDESAIALNSAARKLRDVNEAAHLLDSAAHRLREIPELIAEMESVRRAVRRAHDR